MHEDGGQEAGYGHQCEGQTVGAVDEVGLFCSARAERVHRAPDAWAEEVAEPEDDGVVEGGVVPFDWVCAC